MTPKNPEKTRARIITAAYESFHHQGFQGSSLSQIIEKAGITKGALFHHFANKQELGYAVVDEALRKMIKQTWITPLEGSNDPITVLRGIVDDWDRLVEEDSDTLKNGCPLNNIAQEMAPLDEEFRIRIEKLFQMWRDAFSQAFTRGIECGTVNPRIDPDRTAAFLVASLEGMIGNIKSAQSVELADVLRDGLHHYLDSLES